MNIQYNFQQFIKERVKFSQKTEYQIEQINKKTKKTSYSQKLMMINKN